MTVQQNNPAGRLYSILSEAKAKNPNLAVRRIISEVFELDPASTGEIHSTLASIILLIQNAKQAAERIPNVDRELYVEPFLKIEKAFSSLSTDGPFSQIGNGIDETTLKGLAYCADAMSRLPEAEEVIEKTVLDDLLKDFETLTREVMDSEINDKLKAFLVRSIEDIRTAIHEYRLKGAAGFRQTLDSEIGSLLRHADHARTPKEKNIVATFIEKLEWLDRLVAQGLKVQRILGGVGQLLRQLGIDIPSLPPPPP